MSYKHFLTNTDISTYRMPLDFNGDYDDQAPRPGQLTELSHPALRFYLILWGQCQRKNRPAVELSTEHIVALANIGENHVARYRTELEGAHLIRVTKENGKTLYEVLQPGTGGCPVDVEQPTDDEVINYTSLKLTPNQIRLVFMHYIKPLYLKDDTNGMLFLCPWHSHDFGAGKRKRLSVSLSTGGGLWMCHFEECRKHGKKTITIRDGGLSQNGGGNICDFVAAMIERQLHERIDRKQAEVILKEILEGKRKRDNDPASYRHASVHDDDISTETAVTP